MAMLRIGLFSKLGCVTVKTLRHYDEMGLLCPSIVDEETGYRYYELHQLHALHRIVALRQIGMSIPEITDILNGRNMEEILRVRKVELEAEYQEAANRLTRMNHFLTTIQEEQHMNYQPVIKDIPEYTIFSVRRIIPTYADLLNIVPEVGALVARTNPQVKCVQPDYCFNVYHDGEYKEKDIDVEVCQAVEKAGNSTDEIQFKQLPAAKVVSVLHKGSYDNLPQAYAFLLQWLADNGYQTVGNFRESYIDGCWNKTDPADWLTEIQAPIG